LRHYFIIDRVGDALENIYQYIGYLHTLIIRNLERGPVSEPMLPDSAIK
jgi:hypothetical protein